MYIVVLHLKCNIVTVSLRILVRHSTYVLDDPAKFELTLPPYNKDHGREHITMSWTSH